MSTRKTASTPNSYDAGCLVAPADELTARTLAHGTSAEDDGSLLMAMLGWDGAMLELASSRDRRAGAVMATVARWLLFD